jgi:hypothetical protein
MASPWRICCGVLAAIKSGAGALRACIFERPASISTPAKQTAEADITTSGVTAHFTSLLRMPRANARQKQKPARGEYDQNQNDVKHVLLLAGGVGRHACKRISARGAKVTIVTRRRQ